MTNVEKADSIGILEDLKENYTKEQINRMSPTKFLNAWLEWEGIIGYTASILNIVDLFYEIKTETETIAKPEDFDYGSNEYPYIKGSIDAL